MKAIEAVAAKITAELGPKWRRCKRVPVALLAPLCDAVYAAGINPSQVRLQRYLPVTYASALGPGIYAWRTEKGFRLSKGPLNKKAAVERADLARAVAEPIATAPQTCLDPRNDGRWAVPPSKILSYVIDIENESLRNTMALFALVQAAHPTTQQHDHCRQVADLTRMVALLMEEQSIEDVRTVNPDELAYQVLQGQAGKALTDSQRTMVSKTWFRLRNTFEAYAE